MYGEQSSCIDFPDPNAQPDPQEDAWGLQTCNEMVMPFSQSQVTDMFLKEVWSADAFATQCQQWMGLTPQFTWAIDTFGGRTIKRDFALYSNIIFTNGNLDPWQVGGVTTPINDNIYVKLLEGGAHHLDLRSPNEADPADITAVRETVKELTNTWIAKWRLQGGQTVEEPQQVPTMEKLFLESQ